MPESIPLPIRRFSSRREPLDESFLNSRLAGALSYDRIAGYFSSSILEVAGEHLEAMAGKIRIVCNSELDPDDVRSARAANLAIRKEWGRSDPLRFAEVGRARFVRLAEFLESGKLEVKVVPSHRFGLVHGKAGVITLADGSRTTFMGSANESMRGWKLNYELVWEDPSPDAADWVQEEFEALWNCHEAFPLAEAVVTDVRRIAGRSVIPTTEDWKKQPDPDPAAALVETPVYRREYGLWEHQKYFVQRAFEAHRAASGARFVLADMVGLGKTMQLAMAALLMALWGSRPILIIAPKPLLWQWQDEMRTLLDMPSAVWDGKQWVDENGVEHPAGGAKGILRCPRRVAVVSQGLFTARSEAAVHLESQDYECVIIDEAHRIRRRNLGAGKEAEPADPNNLMAAARRLAASSRSVLLATATPVQLYPVEAWDLLDVLAQGTEHVLGKSVSSRWSRPELCLPIVTGEHAMPADLAEFWAWFRNPVPPSGEGRDFEILRRSLDLTDADPVAPGSSLEMLRPADRQRLQALHPSFGREHNPFIRHIVRRERRFLETTANPETGEPYLKEVRVELLGEGDDDAIQLTDYLRQAYELAEEFCRQVAKRSKGAGFLRTLLLRRAGSTVTAGLKTARKMLANWEEIEIEEDTGAEDPPQRDSFTTLSPAEKALLQEYVTALEANRALDPKYGVVCELLQSGHLTTGTESWLAMGCIVFTQYYDSAEWLALTLSEGPLAGEPIGIYAGSGKSAIVQGGIRQLEDRETLKLRVHEGTLRLIIGTAAASEGLNLQRLGTLINLDLPWNPTRLEQRKGRIQRIGQKRDVVHVYNMRYAGSVEDQVHQILSQRLRHIRDMFGQIPDTLEDLWIDLAAGETEKAKQRIGAIPDRHPFDAKYNQIAHVEWETCERVLNAISKKHTLLQGWRG